MTTSVKTCFKCGAEKPLTGFYKHPMMGDGRLNKCKECAKKDVRQNRRDNIDYYREYDKYRAMLPHRVEMRKQYLKTPEGIEARNRAVRNDRERRPAAHKANWIVGNAIRDGRMIRQPCEVCGNERSDAHHPDYAKPFDVMWLCRAHHYQWHRKNGPGKNADIDIAEMDDAA